MTVLEDEQCLERKAEDHNTVRAALWHIMSLLHRSIMKQMGLKSYSKKPFLLRKRNVLQLNQMLTAEKFCKTKEKMPLFQTSFFGLEIMQEIDVVCRAVNKHAGWDMQEKATAGFVSHSGTHSVSVKIIMMVETVDPPFSFLCSHEEGKMLAQKTIHLDTARACGLSVLS